MLPEAAALYGVEFVELREPEDEEEHPPPDWLPEVEELIDRLNAVENEEHRLLAFLLLYHRRESKPAWWQYFDLRGKPPPSPLDDRDARAFLGRGSSGPPRPHKRSHGPT